MSDHTWPDVTSTAQVEVRDLQQAALQNAASIRLGGESHDESKRQRNFLARGTDVPRWLPWELYGVAVFPFVDQLMLYFFLQV